MSLPIMSVRNIGIRFGGLKALEGVTFDVNEQEILGVIGPNGAGKSTLFNVLSGVYRPTSGEFTFQGAPMAGKKPWEMTKAGISRTFQKIRVFPHMTVEENVMVGALLRTKNKSIAHKKALEVLADVGLIEKKDQLARNLTLVDRKKVELARIICTDPKLLLVDELMTGLTNKECQETIELLITLNEKEGKTIILVEHIMAVIMKISHRLIVLDHGKLIAEGTADEIGKNEKVIEAYLGGNYHVENS